MEISAREVSATTISLIAITKEDIHMKKNIVVFGLGVVVTIAAQKVWKKYGEDVIKKYEEVKAEAEAKINANKPEEKPENK